MNRDRKNYIITLSLFGLFIVGLCVGYIMGFNEGITTNVSNVDFNSSGLIKYMSESNQQFLDVANKQMNLLNDSNVVSNKLFNQNKELFKSYEESKEGLYGCWNNEQRLTYILQYRYGWEDDY